MTRRWSWMSLTLLCLGCFTDPPPAESTTDATTNATTESDAGTQTGDPDPSTTAESADSTTTGLGDCPTGHVDALDNCARWVFVTRGRALGDFGGHTGADEICQNEADSTPLEGTFRAFLREDSEPVSAAWEAIAYDQIPDAVFVMPGDEIDSLVAASPDDLRTDQSSKTGLMFPISRDAEGDPVAGMNTTCMNDSVWTGLTRDESSMTTVAGGTCTSWTTTDGTGQVGSMGQTDERWAGRMANCLCEEPAHFYCFEVVP